MNKNPNNEKLSPDVEIKMPQVLAFLQDHNYGHSGKTMQLSALHQMYSLYTVKKNLTPLGKNEMARVLRHLGYQHKTNKGIEFYIGEQVSGNNLTAPSIAPRGITNNLTMPQISIPSISHVTVPAISQVVAPSVSPLHPQTYTPIVSQVTLSTAQNNHQPVAHNISPTSPIEKWTESLLVQQNMLEIYKQEHKELLRYKQENEEYKRQVEQYKKEIDELRDRMNMSGERSHTPVDSH